MTFTGTSDDVVQLTPRPGQILIVSAKYSGTRNFSIWTLDTSGGESNLLVNEIGAYTGNTLITESKDVALEVSGAGSWTITVSNFDVARPFKDKTPISGVGDDVVAYVGDSGVAHFTHDGSRNFAIWAHNLVAGERDLLVNEIGPYDGKVPIGGGLVLLQITADGAWTAEVAT